MIVIDTSVFTDFFINFDDKRHKKAKMFIDSISTRDFIIYEPFIFDIELAGILRRKFSEATVSEIVEKLKSRIVVLDEVSLHRVAFNVAMNTHCRAVDAYFVAAARLSDSILITNDRIMVDNARNSDIETYYLIAEYDNVMRRIGEI